MRHRGLGWLGAGALLLVTTSAWAQPAADCISTDSQRGVLLDALVQDLARQVEAPRKAGDHARVAEIAAQAQETGLCRIPSAITLAQAEALVALERPCEAAGPLEQYFAEAVPGDAEYGKAETLYETVAAVRRSGVCQSYRGGGVGLAEPTEAAAASHEDMLAADEALPDDGSARDGYRGGELNEGRLAFDSGNYNRAVQLFGVVIQQAPESFEGYFRRAQAYARLKQDREAVADYGRAVELAMGRGYVVVDFARFLASRNRTEDALSLYNDYLMRHPNDVEVLGERAGARLKAGLIDLALEDYATALRLAPGNGDLLMRRAYLYHENGRYGEAAADYTAAIEAGVTGGDVHYRRALAYYGLNRRDAALDDLNRSIAARPSFAAAYTLRATIHQQNGDGAAALADFGKVVDLKPQSAGAYLDRAKEYQRQGDAAAAIADYSAALRYQPRNLDALKGRAMLYQQQGNIANALDDLTQIINREYVDADAYARRGWVYYNTKDYARAMADFDRALTADPNSRQAALGRQACLEAIAAAEKAAAEAARKRR